MMIKLCRCSGCSAPLLLNCSLFCYNGVPILVISVLIDLYFLFLFFTAVGSFNKWRKVRIKNKQSVDPDWFSRQRSTDRLQGHGNAWP